MLLLALALLGHATRVAYTDLPCPLDGVPLDGGGSVRVHHVLSANQHGGWDSDSASYSSRGQFREYAIATCDGNLLSMYGADVRGAAFTDAQASLLRAAVAEEVAALPDAASVEVWERYGIAARVYRELGHPSMALAEIYLQASWVARDAAVGFYAGLEGPGPTRALLDAGERELARELPEATRKVLLYNLARVAHRGGYSSERDRHLAAFEAMGSLDTDEVEALARFRRITREVEPRYQDLAIAELRLALVDPALESRARAAYLLADLLRRRGQVAEALSLYAEVAEDPGAPLDLVTMATALRSELGG